ncbi:M10 family metallopeptidase C-terminal domain-containing protein [Roseomonas sp. CCTCC AB2023176]|uniref:calcium-binding protein n=1 Tax=Roseomonas sp. CCTCC AB2023176 TaxID=3342640 RepID=UPI0035E1022B
MTTLTVGSGKQFSTISSAIAASRDGDVVAVDAGTYVNDFATVRTKITLEAVGGLVHMKATVPPTNGKAILVSTTDLTVSGFEFSGAKVADRNGAGIRYEGGHLTVTDSYFHHNENGILGGSAKTGSITIRDSEFAYNGAGDGYSHNLYVGQVGTLTIDNSYLHDASVGHQIKSRADNTIITNSRIADGATGTGSYSIDLPNGGHAVIENNVIQQGALSGNPAIVAFGAEGNLRAGTSLEMSGNTVLNEMASGSVRLVMNRTTTTADVHDNSVFGLTTSQYGSGPVSVANMTVLTTKPVVDSAHPWSVDPATPTATAGDDVMVLTKAVTGATIDLLGGGDTLTLSSAGANTLTVSNVETIIGGGYADTVTLATPLVGGTIALGAGADRLALSSTGGNDVSVSSVETVVGGSGNDRIVNLGPGARLEGGGGADTLIGSANADDLYGGAATDLLTGGAGADRFIYKAVADAAPGAGERITDFDATSDRLVFSGLQKGAFEFRGDAAFSATKHSEARFDEATHQLSVDVNGDGVADMGVTLDGVTSTSLSKADFLWV